MKYFFDELGCLLFCTLGSSNNKQSATHVTNSLHYLKTILPVSIVLVALFIRELLVERGGGAALPADPTVTSWAVISRESPSPCRVGVGGIGVLLQSLKLGQWDDVTCLRSVPHCPLGGGVVVIEAGCFGVEQLPPLVVISRLVGNSLWRVPHAFTRQQISVHTLSCAWLNDLHPLQPAGREFGELKKKTTTTINRKSKLSVTKELDCK